MTAPFALLGIDHVVLRVHDVQKVRAFYCDVLGCSEERIQGDIGLTQLRAGSALIDLLDIHGSLGKGIRPSSDHANLDHLCLRIDPFDESAIRTHLAGFGIVAGALASRLGAEGAGPSLYLEDPEGNLVELKGPASTP